MYSLYVPDSTLLLSGGVGTSQRNHMIRFSLKKFTSGWHPNKEPDDGIITKKILSKSSIIGKKGNSFNRNAVQKQHLSFHRTPDGQLYVDKWGTMMTRSNCFRNFKNLLILLYRFEPEKDLLAFRNGLGFAMQYQRQGSTTNKALNFTENTLSYFPHHPIPLV